MKYFIVSLLAINAIISLYFIDNVKGIDKVEYNTIPYILPNSFMYKTYTNCPKVLSTEDMELYYKIFSLQHKGDFKTADQLIEKLTNKLLLGYVYYERYESKYYTSTILELTQWLKNYFRLPVANDIYNLLKRKAVKKIPLNVPKPLSVGAITPIYYQKDLLTEQASTDGINLNVIRPIKPQKSNLTKKLDNYLKRGKTKAVKDLLLHPNTKNVLDKKSYAYYMANLSMAYFIDGRDEFSIEWGNKALKSYAKFFPEVNITLGLVYWRKGQYEEALNYFNYVVKYKHLYDDNIVSKAAYWGSRCAFYLQDYKTYYNNLKFASDYSYSFYGILATEELGVSPEYNNSLLDLSDNNVELLLNYDHGKRALALLQFGLTDWAEQELNLFAKYSLPKYNFATQTELLKELVYLAQNIPMPMLSVNLAGIRGVHYGFGHLAYPIFHVGDGTEYIVDPLLIIAIMRRESSFYSGAISKAGAIGLMQLMPSTAKMLLQNISYTNGVVDNKSIKGILKNPKYNFNLGQRYIKMLLKSDNTRGNLVYSLAGWNGGLLNVKKWTQDKFRMPEDPLFFIESIPFTESRNFVKKVLADYWVYQITVGAVPYSVLHLINNQPATYIEPSTNYLEDITSFSYKLEINSGKSENNAKAIETTKMNNTPDIVLSNANKETIK